MKHSLDKSHFYYAMSKDNEAALEISIGDTVEIETHDCFQGQITSEETVLDTLDWDQIIQVVDPLKTARFFVPHHVLEHYDISFN